MRLFFISGTGIRQVKSVSGRIPVPDIKSGIQPDIRCIPTNNDNKDMNLKLRQSLMTGWMRVKGKQLSVRCPRQSAAAGRCPSSRPLPSWSGGRGGAAVGGP
jgi:hypothetical protein